MNRSLVRLNGGGVIWSALSYERTRARDKFGRDGEGVMEFSVE